MGYNYRYSGDFFHSLQNGGNRFMSVNLKTRMRQKILQEKSGKLSILI